jgi:hypothetical protein
VNNILKIIKNLLSSRFPLDEPNLDLSSHVEVQRFLNQAGFSVHRIDSFGFLCTSDLSVWSDVSPLYVRLVPEQEFGLDEIQDLCLAAEAAYGEGLSGHTALIVIDRAPQANALNEIFALRANEDFTVIPLTLSLIVQAQLDGREVPALAEELRFSTGRADLYDMLGPVTDVLSFFGRSELLTVLERQLSAGQSAIIFGARKTGKTSLMGRLRNECGWPVSWVDFQAYGTSLSYVYEDALRSWKRAFQAISLDPPSLDEWMRPKYTPDPAAQGQAFKRAVEQLLDRLAEQPGKPGLLLFLDEVDNLFGQPEYYHIASVLRSVCENRRSHRRFALLAAGLEPALNRVGILKGQANPFFAFFDEIPLGPLEAADARTMVISIGALMGINYTDEALDFLIENSGGHPFLTRQLCSQAIRRLEPPIAVGIGQVTQAAEEYLQRPNNYLAGLWEISSGGSFPAEAKLLQSLADVQPESEEHLIPEDLSGQERRTQQLALQRLRDHCLIRCTEGKWEMTIPLYRRWIRQYILNLPDKSIHRG